MSLLTVLVVLIVVGVILWLVNAYVPMDGKIKNILNIVVVIFLVLWLLKAFGLFNSLNNVRVENMKKVNTYYSLSLLDSSQAGNSM